MVEIYLSFDLELYYCEPYKIWEKSKYYGFMNPFARKYLNWGNLLLLKGNYGYGYDSSIAKWRALNKKEV